MASMSDRDKKPLITKQKPMLRVVYALVPVCIAAIYFFGWRFLAVLAVSNAVGFIGEYLFARVYKQSVTSSVFVTAFLFALSLPPTIPLWIAAVGVAFGIVFGKMVFGGFGKNIFNPALSGRAFIYVSFGVPMTSHFIEPFPGFPGGFAAWLPEIDAVTKSTPLLKLAEGESIPYLKLLLGNTSGALGETCAVLIIICGIYLIIKKAASYHIVLSGITGFLIPQFIFWLLPGVSGVPDPIFSILSGSFLFGIMFMATDPVSASQTTNTGRLIYGALIGILTSLIRVFSVWPEGITFAVLLANMFAPLIDHIIKSLRKRGKVKVV
ncbi:Na(+)-translocating NADH-quinone reductase subunit B [subsurface metagenome]